MARFDFKLEDIEETTGSFEPIPPGEYTLYCKEAELKDTASGSGQYISAVFIVDGPEYKGRRLFHNFNIHNNSAKAEEIGRQQLAGWARACGKPNARDTDELLERKFQARVATEEGNGKYADKSVVKAFLQSNGAQSQPRPVTEKKEEPRREAHEEEPAPRKEPAPAPAKSGKKAPWDD